MLSTPFFQSFCYTEPDNRSVNFVSLNNNSLEEVHLCSNNVQVKLITKSEDICLWTQRAVFSVCCPQKCFTFGSSIGWCAQFAWFSSIHATFLSLQPFLAISTRLMANHAYDTKKNRNISRSLHKLKFISGGVRYGQSECSKYVVRGIRIINCKSLKQRIF